MAERSLVAPGALPLESFAQQSQVEAAAEQLRPHPWDPLEDPSPWLRALELSNDAQPSELSSERPSELSPRPSSPKPSAPWVRLPFQPAAPPLLFCLDRQRSPLERVLNAPLLTWLTPQELQRAERLRRPEDRQRHLLGRAGLRRLLGVWRRQEPAQVPLRHGSHGKPFCPGGPQFNLSHSGDLILLALHPDRPVGVDVEQLRPQLDWRPLAARLLGAAECRELERLPAPLQPRAFLQAWCRLEARLKAGGLGLAGLEALRQRAELAGERLEASPSAAEARVGGLGMHAGAQLWDLRLPEGYCGSLACLVVEEQGEAAGVANAAGGDSAADEPRG